MPKKKKDWSTPVLVFVIFIMGLCLLYLYFTGRSLERHFVDCRNVYNPETGGNGNFCFGISGRETVCITQVMCQRQEDYSECCQKEAMLEWARRNKE